MNKMDFRDIESKLRVKLSEAIKRIRHEDKDPTNSVILMGESASGGVGPAKTFTTMPGKLKKLHDKGLSAYIKKLGSRGFQKLWDSMKKRSPSMPMEMMVAALWDYYIDASRAYAKSENIAGVSVADREVISHTKEILAKHPISSEIIHLPANEAIKNIPEAMGSDPDMSIDAKNLKENVSLGENVMGGMQNAATKSVLKWLDIGPQYMKMLRDAGEIKDAKHAKDVIMKMMATGTPDMKTGAEMADVNWDQVYDNLEDSEKGAASGGGE